MVFTPTLKRQPEEPEMLIREQHSVLGWWKKHEIEWSPRKTLNEFIILFFEQFSTFAYGAFVMRHANYQMRDSVFLGEQVYGGYIPGEQRTENVPVWFIDSRLILVKPAMVHPVDNKNRSSRLNPDAGCNFRMT